MLQGHVLVDGRAGSCPDPLPLCHVGTGRADPWMCLCFQTYIHVIDQRTRKPLPTKFYTDPMVVFHHVNAYEEDGCLLFDVITYEDSSLYELFYLANLNQDFEENCRLTSIPTLRRFAVPLSVDKVMARKGTLSVPGES